MGLIDEIKKDAQQSGIQIQDSEAANLEKELNKLFYLEKDIQKETKFVKQVMTRGAESQERVGLHASALIVGDKDFCIRQQVLSLLYKQLQGSQFKVDLMRIFEEGNAIHEKWQRLLIRGGFAEPEQLDKTQFNKKYRVSYTPDIICTIPSFHDGKVIGEIKSVNTFQFQHMKRHPSAWKQCQWYMGLSIAEAKARGNWNGKDFLKGFVLCEDKNTQKFSIEVYDYDKATIEPFILRCKEIKSAYKYFRSSGILPGRPEDAKTPKSKRCKECPMRDACWNIGQGRIKIC